METHIVDTPVDSNKKQENPLQLDGLDFIEFGAPEPEVLERLFIQLGFQKVGVHKRKSVQLYRQNQINFILNSEPGSFAHSFAKTHGPSICGVGFRVKSAQRALELALDRGGKAMELDESSHSFPVMYGIGDSAIYFVDKYKNRVHYDEDFRYLQSDRQPKGFGLLTIDHLTNNVPKGDMQKWCDFYSKIFNFQDIRTFNIQGAQTGLLSKVMRSPCGKITIPINEPTGEKSQIQEYLDEYKGSGIQHLAFLTPDILKSVVSLKEHGNRFLETPDTYYEVLKERLPNITEDIELLKSLRILADGDAEGYLLQIFTQNMVGPIFFEVIQRKNNLGFGEGNFQALFDAIERDQKARGYL